MKNAGKRMNYALAYAINDTLREVQSVVRSHVSANFTLRKPEFVLREASILKFARPADPNMQGKAFVGQKRRMILYAFEKGGSRAAAMAQTRAPMKGKRAAVPIKGGPARPTFRSEVPPDMRFMQLKLKQKKNTRSRLKSTNDLAATGAGTFKGERRTFIIQKSSRQPEGGVYQRTGPGRRDIRLLYAFVPNQQIPRRLNFERLALTVWRNRIQKNLRSQVDRSMVFHSRKGG